MPVQQVLIRPGMEEGVDRRHLPIGTPAIVQNIRVREGARFEKRPGQTSLGVSGLPASATAGWVTEWGGLPAIAVQDSVDSQLSNSVYLRDDSGIWNTLGRHGFAVPERRVGLAMEWGASLRSVSSVYVDGVLYFAWGDSSDIVYLVAMTPSGVKLRETSIPSSNFPRLLSAGGVLYLVHTDGSTALSVRTVTPSTLLVSAPTSIDTIGGSNTYFDVAAMEGANTWLVAYATGGGGTLRTRVMSGVSSSSTADVAAVGAATLISVVGTSGSKIMLAWVDAPNDAKVTSFSDTLTGAASATVRTKASNETWFSQSSLVRTGSNEWHVMFAGTYEDTSPTVTQWLIYHGRVDGTPALTKGMYRGFRFQPASRLFTIGDADNRRAAIVAHNALTSGQSTNSAHHIIELETTDITSQKVAAISYEHQPSPSTAGTRLALCEAPSLGDGRRACAIHWADPNDITGIDAIVFRAAATSDSMTYAARQVGESAGAMLISGGALYEHCAASRVASGKAFTSSYVVENGWATVPIVNNQVSSGGAMTPGRGYSYAATYAWLDSGGNRVHRSAPSPASTATPTPTGVHLRATVRVAGIGSTGRYGTENARPVAEIYRSWDGGSFYYCGSSDIGSSSSTVTYVDADTDATVEANRTLYTDAGILASFPPSGARLFCVGGGRVWTVGWNPRAPQFSKIIVPTAPVEFCDDDAFRIFGIDEDITAIGWMDGAFVAWARASLFVVTGDGPNDQGVGSFSDPRRLLVSVGADSPHVVEGPAGLFYKGGGTIWLLPRGFGPPQPVGDAIQRTLTAYPFLRGAVRCVNDDDDLTHFLLASSDLPGASTLVVVWNNTLNAWSRDQLAFDAGAIGSVDGVFHAMLATWSANTQEPVRKLEGSTQDMNPTGTATWIESRVGLGGFRPFGPLGWGSFKSLQIHGERAGSCKMNLDVSIDGALYTTAETVATYTVQKDLTSGGEFYAEHIPRVEVGGSWQFDIYDSVSSGLGMTSGLVLHSVAFEATAEDGLRRMSNTERF